jgi:hypothetical protein
MKGDKWTKRIHICGSHQVYGGEHRQGNWGKKILHPISTKMEQDDV